MIKTCLNVANLLQHLRYVCMNQGGAGHSLSFSSIFNLTQFVFGLSGASSKFLVTGENIFRFYKACLNLVFPLFLDRK